MENKFNRLPPHKRFNLIHHEKPTINHQNFGSSSGSSCLPAKKRKETRDPISTDLDTVAGNAVCLPAKKRICALHPNLLPDKPISLFDLNLEYDPKLHEGTALVTEFDEFRAKEEEEQDVYEDEEDGIHCAICQSTDGDPSDPIVFCDGCNLMVHTTCYGNPLANGVPEGDWFCSHCQIATNNNRLSSPSCCLCPNKDGAMKPTNDGRWAHIVCSLFIPEVFFSDPEGREGIDCSKIPGRRWGERCYICKESSGCVLDCSEEKCSLRFHVTCGLKEELCIEYREGRKKGAIVAGFCKTHTDLWMKQQGTGKYKIVARYEE